MTATVTTESMSMNNSNSGCLLEHERQKAES